VSMEWLRADDSTIDRWALFLVYDDRVDVLAVIGATERVDRSMSHDAARVLWAKLRSKGWHHATAEEIDKNEMTYRKLWHAAYGRRMK
jgi:hypothetical protein